MMYGLVDTGADSTLFPASLAAHLGHSLKGAGVKSNVTCGIEQNAVATYRHTFNVELLSPRGNRVTKKFEHIEIDCAESEPPILLGASDILCRFDISIRYRAGELLLRW